MESRVVHGGAQGNGAFAKPEAVLSDAQVGFSFSPIHDSPTHQHCRTSYPFLSCTHSPSTLGILLLALAHLVCTSECPDTPRPTSAPDIIQVLASSLQGLDGSVRHTADSSKVDMLYPCVSCISLGILVRTKFIP